MSAEESEIEAIAEERVNLNNLIHDLKNDTTVVAMLRSISANPEQIDKVEKAVLALAHALEEIQTPSSTRKKYF